jgi:hypothetical protein
MISEIVVERNRVGRDRPAGSSAAPGEKDGSDQNEKQKRE